MRLTLRKRLPIKKLFELKPGEKFVVYWAKDDSDDDIRLDFAEQAVGSIDGETLRAEDAGYEWSIGKQTDMEDNMIDTSRGYAYFFEASPSKPCPTCGGTGRRSGKVKNHKCGTCKGTKIV